MTKLNGRLLDELGRVRRAFGLHPAARVDVDLDDGRVRFFRREALPICTPDAQRAAGDALRAHLRQAGPLGMEDAGRIAAEAFAHSCGAQIEAGDLGANAPATDAAKARRGQPSTRGVATRQLVNALKGARAYQE